MAEPLTRELVAELLAELHVAFPRNVGMQNPAMMADVYRNGLRGVSGEALRFAVARSIQDDQYFPKVARLRELATEWQRRNVQPIPNFDRGDPDVCHVCGARAEHFEVDRWKRDVTPQGRRGLVVDDEGKPIREQVRSVRKRIMHDARLHHVRPAEEGVA